MMQYNTEREDIILTEYGRNIQKMIGHAKTLENKEDRNKAAAQIIEAMGILNKKILNIQDHKKILWDHLAIMANYELDVDFPYPVIAKEELNTKPEKLEYTGSEIKYKHFGRVIEKLVTQITKIEDPEIKAEAVVYVTNHMKKTYLSWNKEVVQDGVIFDSLDKLSDGELQPKKGFTLPRTHEIQSRTRRPRKKFKSNRK